MAISLQQLIIILISEEHIADFLDMSESDVAEIPKGELGAILNEYKDRFDDCDLIEWYTDLVVE